MLKHLFFRPEILSRLIFSLSDEKKYYVQATTQQRAKRALPEEIIRQLFVLSLLHDYKYPEERIRLEWSIQMGREKKRADIVVLDEDDNVLIILEIKVETDQHSMAQLKSYMTITGAKYGALISATEMDCIEMLSTREINSIKDIPVFLEVIVPLTSSFHLSQISSAFTRSGVELDARGYQWDTRIHSEARTKIGDGSWRYKKGVDKDVIAQIEAELRADASVPPVFTRTGIELDAHGYRWDTRIHSEARSKIGDGSWRYKKGVDKDVIAQIEAELGAVVVEIASPPILQSSFFDTSPVIDMANTEVFDSDDITCEGVRASNTDSQQTIENTHEYPAIPSPLTSIMEAPTITNLAEPNEKVIQEKIANPENQISSLQQLIGIEQFERKSKTHANITIKGCSLRLPIVEIDSYKRLRRQFLHEGVVLNPIVKQSEWFALFSHLLESNPVPEQAFELNDVNLQKVAQAVLEAVAQGQMGFAGGWISSLELDKLLQEKRMEKLLPRMKRREMLNKLGYDWHPALREGRSTTGLGERQERPILFITKGHHMSTVTIGTEIAKAYTQAQLPVVQPIISVASNSNDIHLGSSTVNEERQLHIATPVDLPEVW